MSQPETIGESRRYWTHGVESFPSPVAQFRMAQLIDMDDRLYETARVVYRFMVGWYHDDYGDALLSQRHVAKVMKQRAPEGSVVPSRNAVQRAILALMETGWVVRSFQGRGRGKGASRYVPVMNVLELAAQGKFPEPAHATGPVEPAHSNGPLVARANGPVEAEPAHATGPKTLTPDPLKDAGTGVYSNGPQGAGGTGAAAHAGFDRIFAAYDKPNENRAKARRAFLDVQPDADELERMVRSAASWNATAKGKRMSLERWLIEKRWLSTVDYQNDNRPTHRYPSCVITKIKPRLDSGGDFDGATIWFRDRAGTAQHRVLDGSEFDWLQECCLENARLQSPSDDLHEFVGARFQLDGDGFIADPSEREAA